MAVRKDGHGIADWTSSYATKGEIYLHSRKWQPGKTGKGEERSSRHREMEQLVARWGHSPEVGGSNPSLATKTLKTHTEMKIKDYTIDWCELAREILFVFGFTMLFFETWWLSAIGVLIMYIAYKLKKQ